MNLFSRVALVVFGLFAGQTHAAFLGKANATIPITEKVMIEGTEVYSQSAGHALLNTCSSFAPSLVKDDSKPSITVCGIACKIRLYNAGDVVTMLGFFNVFVKGMMKTDRMR